MTGALVNGSPATTVDLADRGLHYGDGVFETIAVVNGVAPLFDRHMRRLEAGCRRLALDFPGADVLAGEARALTGTTDRAVLKIIVTRGAGQRGYRLPAHRACTRICIGSSWPVWPRANRDQGVILRLCRTRLSSNERLAGIKHLNRLEQIMARMEWSDPDIADGLMCDEADRVVEATSANVFAVIAGSLVTPDLARAGVSGVMREVVMEVASRAEIGCIVRDLSLDELAGADEVFLTNSLIGLWPVRKLADPGLANRTLSPGPLTAALSVLLEDEGMLP